MITTRLYDRLVIMLMSEVVQLTYIRATLKSNALEAFHDCTLSYL